MLARRLEQTITLRDILGTHGSHVRQGFSHFAPAPRVTETGWRELDRLLPDGGFTPGVVELAAPHALGGGTSIALSFMRAVQQKGAAAQDGRGWCAWVEAQNSSLGHLYAPGVAQAGVDLDRLLVVRVAPSIAARVSAKNKATHAEGRGLVRAALKIAASGGFDGLAVSGARLDETAVRKFALSSEEHGTTVFLLTDSLAPHAPWPVTLRLELLRTGEGISVHVTKDKRGRSGASGGVPMNESRLLPAPTEASVRLLDESAPRLQRVA